MITLSGYSFVSCCCISHTIGEIYPQSLPAGQHIAELSSSRPMHVESEGQQKSFGSFVLLQRAYEEGHVSGLLGRISSEANARPGVILAIRAKSNRTDVCPRIPAVDFVILAI